MRTRRRARRPETLEEMRARLVAETSAWLTECLRHPELAVQIPTIPAGRGRFPRSMSETFWEPLLCD